MILRSLFVAEAPHFIQLHGLAPLREMKKCNRNDTVL